MLTLNQGCRLSVLWRASVANSTTGHLQWNFEVDGEHTFDETLMIPAATVCRKEEVLKESPRGPSTSASPITLTLLYNCNSENNAMTASTHSTVKKPRLGNAAQACPSA